MAIPNGDRGRSAIPNFVGPQTIIEANFSSAFATVYLLVVSAAIFVCCMSIMTSTVRLAFGMARDNQLPLLEVAGQGEPAPAHAVGPCIAVALLSAIPFIQFAGATIIAVAATAMIYLSYLLGNVAVLRARLRGLAEGQGAVHARAWGKLVNVLGILWGAGDAGELPVVHERRIPSGGQQPEAEPDRLLRNRAAGPLRRLPEQASRSSSC